MYRLFLALRYLRSRLVNLISIAGVMAGVAVLIVVVSIMDGFQTRVRAVVRGNLSHIIMTPAPTVLPFDELERRLQEVEPHVEAAAPQIELPVFFEYKTQRLNWAGENNIAWHQMEACGIDWERERKVSELESYLLAVFRPGEPFFHPVAAERMKGTVLVSRTFADNFLMQLRDGQGRPLEGKALRLACESLIGEEVRIMWGSAGEDEGGQRQIFTSSRNLIISGVYDGQDAVDDVRRVYFSIDQLRRMGRIRHEYLTVRVKLDNYEHAKAVKKSLSGIFPGYAVETWEDQKADFLGAVNNEKVLLVIVLSFIIMLGGFVILATLTLTVVEKTRDIGILAALGAGRTGILTVFLWNGLLIGIIGAVLGLGLGWVFTDNVNWVNDRLMDMGVDVFPAKIYHFRRIPTVWDWTSNFVIMGGSVLVAFLAGLVPAMRAARLDPIAALRYE